MLTADDVNFVNGMIDMALFTERRRLADKIRSFTRQLEGQQVNYTENMELLAKIIESK